MNKWHTVGIFETEESARILVPHFFEDKRYEAHFRIEDGKDVLIVNKNYWLDQGEGYLDAKQLTSMIMGVVCEVVDKNVDLGHHNYEVIEHRISSILEENADLT